MHDDDLHAILWSYSENSPACTLLTPIVTFLHTQLKELNNNIVISAAI